MKNKIFIITIILCLLLTGCKTKDIEDTASAGKITESAEETLPSSKPQENKAPTSSESPSKEEQPYDENQAPANDNSENEQTDEEEYTDILTKLKKAYPNAVITEKDGKYSVVSDNIDFTAVQNKQQHGISDRAIYFSMQELLESRTPLRDCIFIGEKTGETKQYIPINSKGQVDGLYYTESKVKVTKALYGDISEGDIITLKESYAVFNGNNDSILLYSSAYPISKTKSLYTVGVRSGKETLFGDDRYYYPIIDGCFSIDSGKKLAESKEQVGGTDVTAKELYEKYIVKGDVALDKEAEISKAQKAVGDSPLSTKQLEKIDELCQKYGQVKK